MGLVDVNAGTLQQGIAGGEIIQAVVFSIILCSTFFTTFLTFLVDKTFVSYVYEWIFRLMGLTGGTKSAQQEEDEPEMEVPDEKGE